MSTSGRPVQVGEGKHPSAQQPNSHNEPNTGSHQQKQEMRFIHLWHWS